MSLILPESIDLQFGNETVLPKGFSVGHAQDVAAATGCTAIIHENGAVGAVSVRGAAPATIETDLLEPRNTVERINAVLLSGGSAFGLEAASGVMRWLSEHKAGFEVSGSIVPIVCGASIFDLTLGEGEVFPDKDMGYAACESATTRMLTGNVGAGTGASVGKMFGEAFSMKSGLGCASTCFGELVVAALAVVNAVGNVYDRTSGKAIAGVRDPENPSSILDPYQAFLIMDSVMDKAPTIPENTTISCVLTNGTLTKAQATHVADMAHDGYARAIEPVHTGFDGDTVFVLASGMFPCSSDLIGILAARVIEAAIHVAATSAKAAYGLPSAFELSASLA